MKSLALALLLLPEAAFSGPWYELVNGTMSLTGVLGVSASTNTPKNYVLTLDGPHGYIKFPDGTTQNTASVNISSAAIFNSQSNTWTGSNSFTATGTGVTSISSATVGALTLGSGPAFATKYFSGTTEASVNADTLVAHGLTLSNILFVMVRILNSANNMVQPSYNTTADANYFNTYFNSTNIVISIGPNSTNLTSRPYTVLVWYKL